MREDSLLLIHIYDAMKSAAIRLYHRLGYNCRKDLPGYEYDVVCREPIHGLGFEIRKDRDGES